MKPNTNIIYRLNLCLLNKYNHWTHAFNGTSCESHACPMSCGSNTFPIIVSDLATSTLINIRFLPMKSSSIKHKLWIVISYNLQQFVIILIIYIRSTQVNILKTFSLEILLETFAQRNLVPPINKTFIFILSLKVYYKQ